MSRYLVEINDAYLSLGRLKRRENATLYPHPSAARAALKSYRARTPGVLSVRIIDTRQPARNLQLWQAEVKARPDGR